MDDTTETTNASNVILELIKTKLESHFVRNVQKGLRHQGENLVQSWIVHFS